MEKFWEMVEIANYTGNNFDHIKSRKILINNGYNQSDFNEAFHITKKLSKNLEEACNNINYDIGKGDDGLSDLFAYIISFGKDEYQSYIDEPLKFKEFNVNTFAPESFIYTFLD